MPPVTYYHIHSTIWYPVFTGLPFPLVQFQPNLHTLTFPPSFSFSPTFTIPPPGTEWLALSGVALFKKVSRVSLCISCTWVLIYGSYTYLRYLYYKNDVPRRMYDHFTRHE